MTANPARRALRRQGEARRKKLPARDATNGTGRYLADARRPQPVTGKRANNLL